MDGGSCSAQEEHAKGEPGPLHHRQTQAAHCKGVRVLSDWGRGFCRHEQAGSPPKLCRDSKNMQEAELSAPAEACCERACLTLPLAFSYSLKAPCTPLRWAAHMHPCSPPKAGESPAHIHPLCPIPSAGTGAAWPPRQAPKAALYLRIYQCVTYVNTTNTGHRLQEAMAASKHCGRSLSLSPPCQKVAEDEG